MTSRRRPCSATLLSPLALALLLLPTPARAEDDPPAREAPRAPPAPLAAPLAAPRNSFFYATLGLPLLRDARTLAPGQLQTRLRFSQTRSAVGAENIFEGIYREYGRLELRLGLSERIELYAGARLTGWDEHVDTFELSERGDPRLVVEGEQLRRDFGQATSRHENVSEFLLGLQVRLWTADDGRAGVAAGLQVKSPGFRRRDITNSNTTDLAPTLLASLPLGERLLLHLNAGVVVPLGETWLFENDAGITRTLAPFPQAALGLTWVANDWLALGAGLEASGRAFRAPHILREPPLTAWLGVRLRQDWWTVEAGGGAGLTSHSADCAFWLEVSLTPPPLWGGEPAPPGAEPAERGDILGPE